MDKILMGKVTTASSKVKLRSWHDVAHLQSQPMSLQGMNFLHFTRYNPDKILKVKVSTVRSIHLTLSEIQPGQAFQTQGHHGKVKSQSHHDVAHLHFSTNITTKYELPTPYGF